jgi:hypothetical protein
VTVGIQSCNKTTLKTCARLMNELRSQALGPGATIFKASDGTCYDVVQFSECLEKIADNMPPDELKSNYPQVSDWPVQVSSGKTPHKCPVCQGSGRVYGYLTTTAGAQSTECHACGGKGVLWG